uniref:Ac45-VOA1_TM domain-containing protein n=1 Tax=Heterorhabditis bacteriophora TaxID=37862 RepID=A0A1I7XKK0_HETBA
MRILLIALALSVSDAYDSVIFSNERKISHELPSLDNLLASSNVETPLVFLVNPDFTLGQFSKHVSAYSTHTKIEGLAKIVKNSRYHTARYIDSVISSSASVVTSADDFQLGSSIYIIAGEDWASMDSLFMRIMPKLGEKYVAVIAATNAVSNDKNRVKRVSTNEMEESRSAASSNGGTELPLSLPPYKRTGYDVKPDGKLGSCLLYLEGVDILVMNKKQKSGESIATIPLTTNSTTWSYVDGDVECSNNITGNYTFTVRLTVKNDVFNSESQDKRLVKMSANTEIIFTLKFTSTSENYWNLQSVNAKKLSVESVGNKLISGTVTAKPEADPTSVKYMGFISVPYFSMVCSSSQAAWFHTDQENIYLGISLSNSEVQPYGVVSNNIFKGFTSQVEDCIGTFSPGSWMGIISSLILLGGFIFGFLMLNSVQTMDRFDDPKHKQIVINVRE